MTTVQKLGTAFIGVLMLTTAVLPGRQTPALVEKLFGGLSQLSKTAIGQG